MSSFTNFDKELNIRYDKIASKQLGKDHFVVTEAFEYRVGDINSNVAVRVPIGYLTDGASVPRALYPFLPNWSDYGQAAVLHDYLCDYGVVINNGKEIKITRKEADSIFNESMKVLGISNTKRRIMMSAVNAYRTMCRPITPGIKPEKEQAISESVARLAKEFIRY